MLVPPRDHEQASASPFQAGPANDVPFANLYQQPYGASLPPAETFFSQMMPTSLPPLVDQPMFQSLPSVPPPAASVGESILPQPVAMPQPTGVPQMPGMVMPKGFVSKEDAEGEVQRYRARMAAAKAAGGG
mmetsp:Transcript_133/g.301  ORF Transcript_133/g.301 Transcript_133/m.301 type:complete len:131 (+) Transcript_133:133-525(+)|eukprot:CAMPEP_0181318318 /NCGR_PEP_ID=MMETSP1101-20121128/16941_1 /TAXON_ID=46948 /ORGANISM="Rhodomonas abbreviata, Strain Caron Lab Isolate" /LENGTH=130 /DNA_ID=CAMNT_0023425777 /DNA_START=132 /DNA_END=524 /DNA_ORIENTATION=+